MSFQDGLFLDEHALLVANKANVFYGIGLTLAASRR